MTLTPLGPLVRLLQFVSSRDAAEATIGDAVEELEDRIADGRAPHLPVLWLNLVVTRAVIAGLVIGATRLARSFRIALTDAVRAIRAAPVHSLVVTLVLACGITLGTVTYSIVDAVVLKPLPIDDSERLVNIPTWQDGKPVVASAEVFWRLDEQMTTVEDLAAHMTMGGLVVDANDVTDGRSVMHATADLFRLLRLSPAIGRFWSADDEASGDTNVAVIGYRFWRDRFAGDPSVVGRTISIERRTYTVIGVLPATSDHPDVQLLASTVWIPMPPPRDGSNHHLFFGLVARMHPGVSPRDVGDEVKRLSGVPDWKPDVRPLLHGYVESVRRWMLLALGAAALVVLVGCANAANLMLTRAIARTQEMAVRASLGASRRQIAVSVLVEGLLLSTGATACALLFSIAGVAAAKAAVMTALPGTFRAASIALNGRVFAAAVVCAIVTGMMSALVPAWQTSRTSVSILLKDASAPTTTGRRRWRSTILTTEIATVVVLLVVSWLFVVSLIRAAGVDLGIDRANLLAVNPRLDFQITVDEVQQRLERVPGVVDVATARGAGLPIVGRAFGGAWITTTIDAADAPATAPVTPLTTLRYNVTSNYFSTAGLAFRQGDTWPAGTSDTSPVVVVDERVARHLFGGDNPIGRQIRAASPAGTFTVIGVVPYVQTYGPEESAPPAVYFPLRPDPARRFAVLFVRTSRPPQQMQSTISDVLAPIAPVPGERIVFAADDALSRLTATRRFLAALMSVFGIAGGLLGAVGVYAVMASFVAQQTREIGVRLALGASPSQVLRGVLTLAWRHLLAGIVLGVPVAWWLSRGFATMLFQVTPADATVYLGVGTLVAAIGLLAAWIPARRAGSIDPIVSLRR